MATTTKAMKAMTAAAAAAVESVKADTKVEAADPDAVFGRFMLTLGQVVRGVQLLRSDPKLWPITAMSNDLCSALRSFDNEVVSAYEPLLAAYAEARENGTAVG